MPTCNSCGGSNNPGQIYCIYCDRHLASSFESKYSDKFVKTIDEITTFEKEKINEIKKISRNLRNGSFNMSHLDKLTDLEEDILEINSDFLLHRFSELVFDISVHYLKKNSICIFGSNKDLFGRYL